jgi:putative ABC transport system substrate-binding protein
LSSAESPSAEPFFLSHQPSAATWPLAARAQQPTKPPTIGFAAGTPSSHGQWAVAFAQRLRELGWIEGRTIVVDYRWTEGRTERAAEIAAEFAHRRVDVIVTSGTGMVLAAKQATLSLVNASFRCGAKEWSLLGGFC